jgi:hypothetical protein
MLHICCKMFNFDKLLSFINGLDRIDRSDVLVQQVYELAPVLNGILGKSLTKIHRYMITLYAASHIPAFSVDGKQLGNSNYFTLYALSKVAKVLNDIKYERTRVAMRVYKWAEEKGYVEIRKDKGQTYITITEKGDNMYYKVLINLITLNTVRSIDPEMIERSLKDDHDGEFISKGKHHKMAKDELLLFSLLSDLRTLNNEAGTDILSLNEDETI